MHTTDDSGSTPEEQNMTTEATPAEEAVVNETITPEVSTEEVVKPRGRMSIKTMLSALSAAVNSGEMNSRQAAELRRQFGITKSQFTKRRPNAKKLAARKKTAKASRRKNRGTGKGEKRTGGVRGV